MTHTGPFDAEGKHAVATTGDITWYCCCERDRQAIANLRASAAAE